MIAYGDRIEMVPVRPVQSLKGVSLSTSADVDGEDRDSRTRVFQLGGISNDPAARWNVRPSPSMAGLAS